MPRRNDIAKNALRLACGALVFAVFSLLAGAQNIPQNTTRSKPEQCAPDLKNAPARIFANPGVKVWKGYRPEAHLPELNGDAGEKLVAVQTSRSNARFVQLMESGEDYASSQMSCFGTSGQLLFQDYEIRTAWGWGFSDVRRYRSGKMLSHGTRFFDVRTGKTIPKPDDAGNVPDFLKPTTYKTFDSMPFIAALKQEAHATPQ